MGEYITATWGWDEAWQEDHFRDRWHPDRLTIVEYRGRLVGMFDIEERPGELYLETIEIAPAYQSKGIGTNILREILNSAGSQGLAVGLHVLRVNRARHLYERLGFAVVDETDVRLAMSARPAGAYVPVPEAARPLLSPSLMPGVASLG
jgi:ribosomal protein S18 acetylase RimI-like enzyme